MTKKIRLILFSFFALIFFIAAPQIIFYSLGYKFDFKKVKIVQTGGIHLKVVPRGVSVFLNGNFRKKTGTFFDSVLIKNLMPKKYQVSVKKENYHTWEKTLTVKEGQVASANHITLFKQNPVFKAQPLADIIKDNEKISELTFIFNPNRTLIKTNRSNYYLFPSFNLSQVKSRQLDFLNATTTQIRVNSQNPDQILFLKQNSLYLKNINQNNHSPSILEKNIIAYDILENNNIIWLEKEGVIKIFSLQNIKNSPQQLLSNPIDIKKGHSYKIKLLNEFVFIQDNNKLLLLDKQGESTTFPGQVKDIKISPDKTKMLYLGEHELTYSPISFVSFNNRKIEKTFITRLSQEIKNGFWINNHYLVFRTKNNTTTPSLPSGNLSSPSQSKIKISEIDVRDKPNIYELPSLFQLENEDKIEIENPKIFWNKQTQQLYVIDKNNLLISEKLIP